MVMASASEESKAVASVEEKAVAQVVARGRTA